MKREHFAFISKHFDLTRYNQINRLDVWCEDFEGRLSNIHTSLCYGGLYGVAGKMDGDGDRIFLFIDIIPSRFEAEQIVSFIKETEILFT